MTERMSAEFEQPLLAAASIEKLRHTLAAIMSSADLDRPLDAVCDGLYDLLGCHAVVLNLVEGSDMRVVAVAGGDDLRSMLGQSNGLALWQHLMDSSQAWGALRFCRDPRPIVENVFYETYDDEFLMFGDDEHWGSLNMLVAPMYSPSDNLIGAVTLDLFPGMPIPDQLTRTVLELFTSQAGFAIHQRQLAERIDADNRRLKLSEERYRLAFDNAPIGMTEFALGDGKLGMTRMNAAAAAILATTVTAASGRAIDDVVAVAGEPLGPSAMRALETGERLQREVLLRTGDSADVWAIIDVVPLPATGGHSGVLCQLVDITEARASALELERRAHRDSLTGLANRTVVMERLSEVVTTARQEDSQGALLFCDLDNFKVVNDQHGHLVGDDVLSELATRLDSCVRIGDTAGRFGGDEFVIVAYPMSLRSAQALGQRLSERLSAPIVFDGDVMRVHVSIGIAMITGTVTPAEVVRRADAAMYAARGRAHRPTYVIDTA